jgi:hypothetical protein
MSNHNSVKFGSEGPQQFPRLRPVAGGIRWDSANNDFLPAKSRKTPTLWRPHLMPSQQTLFCQLLEAAREELESPEGFDVMVVIESGSGVFDRKFLSDSMEESVRIAEKWMFEDPTTSFYALLVLFSLNWPSKEDPRIGFMVSTERNRLLSCLNVFCEFDYAGSGQLEILVPSYSFRSTNPNLPANRAYNANALRQIGLGPLLDGQNAAGSSGGPKHQVR